MKLDDQFEWDIENPHASPEGFADIYVQELGLGGEFRCVSSVSRSNAIIKLIQNCDRPLYPRTGASVPKVPLPSWTSFRWYADTR